MMRKNINQDELKKLYEEGMSTRDIAKLFDVGQTTIRRHMDKAGIATRSHKEGKATQYHLNKMNPLWESYKKDETRQCEFCGEDFSTKPWMKQKYCKRECQFNHLSAQLSHKIETKCDNCGHILYRIESRLSQNINNFCNSKCLGEWRSKNLIGEKSYSWDRVIVKCGYCLKELSVPKNRLEHDKQYCNKDCMAKDYSNRFSGELSPTWKGGFTKKNYGKNWIKARRETRDRDDYKCIRCNKSEVENGEELSVHHIKLFRLCKDYLEANQPDNLISLCRECHTFVHSRYNEDNEYLT